jgi:hypothetical protein
MSFVIKKVLFSFLFVSVLFQTPVLGATTNPNSKLVGYPTVTEPGPLQHMSTIGLCDRRQTIDSAECYTQFTLGDHFKQRNCRADRESSGN